MYPFKYSQPELITAEAQLRAAANAEGITYTFADQGEIRTQADTTRILGYRDADYAVYLKQLRAARPGAIPIPLATWRPIAQFGNSYHNYGAAFDVKIVGRPAGMTGDAALARLGQLAPRFGLRWGGTFPADRKDPPHFELAITLTEAHQRWAKLGGLPGIPYQIAQAGKPAAGGTSTPTAGGSGASGADTQKTVKDPSSSTDLGLILLVAAIGGGLLLVARAARIAA